MIFLDITLTDIGALILVILGIVVLRYIFAFLLGSVAQITGKTFVRRRGGEVLATPQLSKPHQLFDDPIKKSELETAVQKIKSDFLNHGGADFEKLKTEVEGTTIVTKTTYVSGTNLSKVKIAHENNSNENARAELIRTLIDCGLSNEFAITKAMEKYPLGS